MLTVQRKLRKTRVRAKVKGTTERPRLTVYRSNKAMYAQLIDDVKHVTICEAHGTDSKAVGEEIATKAMKGKIEKVVFDRAGYQFHGRVKAVADAAREKGLVF